MQSALLLLALVGCDLTLGEPGQPAPTDPTQTPTSGTSGTTLQGDATVTGRVDVEVGAASRLEIWTPGTAGTLVGAGGVEADGTFAVDVVSGHQRVLIHALAQGGERVASAILETTGGTGARTVCTPLDRESTVEADVFAEMVARAGIPDALDPIDLRSRLDASTAAAVDASTDRAVTIAILAEAMLTAQATEIEAWSARGVEVTQQALFEAELGASLALSAALDAGEDATSAHAEFRAGLQAAAEAVAGAAPSQGEVASQVGAALRAVVELHADATTAAEAVAHAAAVHEARLQRAAVSALAEGHGATGAALASAHDAGAVLVSDCEDATSPAEIEAAYATFEASLVGSSGIQGSVTDQLAGLELVEEIALDVALGLSTIAAAELDAAIAAEVAAAGEVDPQALALAIVQAYAAFHGTAQAEVALALQALSPAEIELCAGLVTSAVGSLRGSAGR